MRPPSLVVMRLRSAAVCLPEKQSLMRGWVGRVPARVGPKGPPELALFTSTMRPPSMGAMEKPPPRWATTQRLWARILPVRAQAFRAAAWRLRAWRRDWRGIWGSPE